MLVQVIPVRIGHRIRIAVVGGPTDGSIRAPVVVEELIFEHIDVRITDVHIEQGDGPRRFPDPDCKCR